MKDRTILSIKGVAIVGVVLHHLINRRTEHDVAATIKFLQFCLGWCVLGFIAISGFLHASSDSRRTKGLAEFIFLRFNRLVVPWLLLILVYALIWQLLQAMHFSNIAVKIPNDFFGKVAVSLWPTTATVGEQLYYLPILFGASGVFVLVRAALGLTGVWVLAVAMFIIGLRFYPKSFTGFEMGVFVWSVQFYAAGYLLYIYREELIRIRLMLGALTLVLFLFSGHYGIVRIVPLWLMVEGAGLRLASIPGLAVLGEASGTIYIYHTPFIVQPLVILATSVHGYAPQLAASLVAGAAAMGICAAFYYLAKNTRAKILLM